MVESGGTAVKIGFTDAIPLRKRMWKYHSSVVEKGCTPLVIGCWGKVVKSASQCGFTLQMGSQYPPIQSRNSASPLFLGTSVAQCNAIKPQPRFISTESC